MQYRWLTTLKDKRKSAIIKIKFLRKIRGPEINNFTLRYEIRSYEEVYHAFEEWNIIWVIRAKILGWLSHILRPYIIAKEVLSWKPRGKRALGRPKQRWSNKVSKELTMLGVENYREVAMDERER